MGEQVRAVASLFEQWSGRAHPRPITTHSPIQISTVHPAIVGTSNVLGKQTRWLDPN